MSLRIGLLGASRIAPIAMIAPARAVDGVQIVAVAASTPERARDFAEAHGLEAWVKGYAELIARVDLDLVYISLPPSAHARWAIAALRAGKHVLVEKPFAMSAVETEAIQEEAMRAGKRVIEAAHYRCHPMIARAVALLRAGAIGDVQTIKASFSAPVPISASEFRWNAALGGGAMRDLGFYPLHLARTLTGEEPVVRGAQAVWREPGVDAAMRAELAFPGGAAAEIACDMRPEATLAATALIEGSAGRMTLEAFVQPAWGSLRWRTADGEITEPADPALSYVHQLRAVNTALETAAPMPSEGADTLSQMRAIDALYAAAGE